METNEAIGRGITLFGQTVRSPSEEAPILKKVVPGAGNKKLHGGRYTWRAGAYPGLPLYALTLEERATCPASCTAWTICYGNHMPFATRYSNSNYGLDLMVALVRELDYLDVKHPKGYSIRLHVLGDFFSVGYVRFWGSQLDYRPGLHTYGYSHRDPSSDAIGRALDEVWHKHGERFNILASSPLTNAVGRPRALLETDAGADKLPVCPEQTGAAKGCLDCGLCTLPYVAGVTFKIH